VEASYELPFLAHAAMEPLNATAHVRPDGCDVWAPMQNQSGALDAAVQASGLPAERIRLHNTLLGGGFGRRLENDVVVEAIEVSRAVGAPVKVVWSREDDTRHDFFRPASYHRVRATLGADGAPAVMTHRVVGHASAMARWAPDELAKGIDGDHLAGLGAELPYAVPNYRVEYAQVDTPVPTGWWRAVGHTGTGFVAESFIDELAHAAGRDPVEYRRWLMRGAPRLRATLDLAAERSGWGSPLPAGRGRGVASVAGFGSFVTQVAEVSVGAGGEVRVHRVVCAIDCGTVINPAGVIAQIESGIVYGLAAALTGEITIADGRVVQSNFHDYPVLRLPEMPMVEVHIVPSTEPPGGVGEPGVPPIAPAVANALFAASGRRVRKLPIRVA
jgi:isoquinoline 1-oxidoreductase beta subunit